MSRAALAAALWCGLGFAAELPSRSIDITLERGSSEGWQSVNPQTVFRAGDEIRFRFRSTRGGYLYVLNQTSDGSFLWLYPSKATGLSNRIQPGQEYQVPATDGAFRIPPTPGYDTIYWIVSADLLRNLPELPDPVPPRREALMPRCQGELLRARGRCEDSDAGAKPLAGSELLPRQLTPSPKASTDIVIKEVEGKSQITFPDSVPLFGYQFVIAHR